MPPNKISDRNPDLDKIREQGWAWVRTNGHGKYGAPYADEEYGLEIDPQTGELTERLQPGHDVRIIYWDEDA